MKKVLILSLIPLLGLLAGCQTTTVRKAPPQVILPAVTYSPVAGSESLHEAESVASSQPSAPRPFATKSNAQGVSVYTAPKIVKTTLAPYEDEKGRIFGPQQMYEIVSPGRLNPDALEQPDLAFIPVDNLVVPPGMGNPVSGVAMEEAYQEAPRMPIDIIDPRDITVTGLLSRDANNAQAARMADAAKKRAVFDQDLGWILVPMSGVQ